MAQAVNRAAQETHACATPRTHIGAQSDRAISDPSVGEEHARAVVIDGLVEAVGVEHQQPLSEIPYALQQRFESSAGPMLRADSPSTEHAHPRFAD
jgi:hypothetical protein